MTTTPAPPATRRSRPPATQWRALQAIWGFGLVISVLLTPIPSLVICGLALLAYYGSPAWRSVRRLVTFVAVVDVIILAVSSMS
jgi:hypothetical protein